MTTPISDLHDRPSTGDLPKFEVVSDSSVELANDTHLHYLFREVFRRFSDERFSVLVSAVQAELLARGGDPIEMLEEDDVVAVAFDDIRPSDLLAECAVPE